MTQMPTLVARKHYSLAEIYQITVVAARTVWQTRRQQCDKRSSERVMLAVTEVNGCELCSYAHSRFALQMGMTEDEVRGLLNAQTTLVPAGDLPGIAFGQHYADSRGRPDPQAWDDLVAQVGPADAQCALRAARMMMWGNATGIPLSSLRSRLRGRPDPRSSVHYEVFTALGTVALTAPALAQAILRELHGRPLDGYGSARAKTSHVGG